MRWALVKVCLAVTAMVVVAFAVPLGLVVKEMARDRAFSNAERQAATVGPALAITTDRAQLERAVASTQAGADGRMAVHVPATEQAGGARRGGRAARASRSGGSAPPISDLATARRLGRASTAEVPGGYTLLQPTAVGSRRDRRRRGVRPRRRGHQRRRPPPGWCSRASASP